eukprot:TRINITY_DN585_c0_g1_i2.p1 TRINITY_DN585_c0_g1~~TRINITY_DN585_c0_g1_i2.p1  ORF type:complete len:196 (+),score=23.60 TRINITY_DN585_c0_g1_i2:52-588(+)
MLEAPVLCVDTTASYTGCIVSCNNVRSTCTQTPIYSGNMVYCQCLSQTSAWSIINPASTACPFWPTTPFPPSYEKCLADYNGSPVPCVGKPTPISGSPGKLYCDCGDHGSYIYPITNLNTADCAYTASAVNEESTLVDSSSGLSTGQWVGICFAIVVLTIIIIGVIIFVMRKKESDYL